jgi:hypothetical protein
MRRKIYIFIILLATSCQTGTNKTNQLFVQQIVSEYIDFGIETIIDVRCEEFNSQFANETETKVIDDPNKNREILKHLNNLKPAGKEYYQNVDTRMKLKLTYNTDSVETICIDNFIVQRNDKLYVRTDSLTDLLISRQ